MIEQRFIDRIEELRRQTYSKVIDIQNNLCPMAKSIYLNYQFDYWYEGYKYHVWEDDVHVYAVNELPYCYDNELKNTTFMDSLDHLIAGQKIWPLLLFINGTVIPWSHITVIHDYDYTYLKIDQIDYNFSISATMVVFPLHYHQIRYGEDNDILVTRDRKGFYFGVDGTRLEKTDFADISVRFEILDKNIYYKEINIYNSSSGYLRFSDLPDGYVPTLDNILTFTYDGYYNGTNIIEDRFNGSYGIFKLNTDSDESNIKWAILMYNMKDTNKESSYLYSKGKDLDRNSIVKLLTQSPQDTSDEIWTNIIYPLIQPFDFRYFSELTSEDNIDIAIDYITSYDFSLWKDAFIKNIGIESFAYTGAEFKSKADSKGVVRFSRKHSDLIEDVIIVFVNNKLYEYMTDVIYSNNTINIPTFGIINDDYIEIIMYHKCNNNVLDIKVPDANTPVYIHPEYDLENCYIMTSDLVDPAYTVISRDDQRIQYVLNFTYTKDGSNYYITFDHDEYYNKVLKIVPKNQYRYYRFKFRGGEYQMTLPTQFNYCHDPERYLVFINGKKIDRTEYTITIMNENRPFNKLSLYVATVLDNDDYVDVFYIPEPMIEAYHKNSILDNGLLLLDKEHSEDDANYPTTYPLSKYTTMIFVNGLKVNTKNIKDISMNKLLIDIDKYKRDSDENILVDHDQNSQTKPSYVNSIDNVTIVEYIHGNEKIANVLDGDLDSWSKLVDLIIETYATIEHPYAGIEKLFGALHHIEDPDENYKNNFTSLRSVLYDIIINSYLSQQNATTGEQFVYDFEQEYFESEDDTRIVPLFIEKDKIVDYNIEAETAEPEDVEDGYLFNQ